jgi:branched-chain amino acid transport system substrate-binding protein
VIERCSHRVAVRRAMAALEQIDQLDLGGFRIGFGPGKREGSQFVDVAVVGQGGRVLS